MELVLSHTLDREGDEPLLHHFEFYTRHDMVCNGKKKKEKKKIKLIRS